MFDLENMDAVEYLKTLSDSSVDLLCTDIPYESLEKHRKTGTTTRLKKSKSSSNDWFTIFPNDRISTLFFECQRVLKKDRHLYFFCDQETMFVAKPLGEEAGFKFWKPIVWDKQCMGMGYHYRAQYEFILFFEKGKRKLNNLGIPDVLSFKRIKSKDAYPTEKPVDLLEVLITQSTQPGELVCDPLCGSGSAAVAALRNGRCFAGNDISELALETTLERIEAVL